MAGLYDAKKAAQFANEREGREHVGAVLLLFSAAGFAVPEEAWLRVADVTADGRRMAVPSPIPWSVCALRAPRNGKAKRSC